MANLSDDLEELANFFENLNKTWHAYGMESSTKDKDHDQQHQWNQKGHQSGK